MEHDQNSQTGPEAGLELLFAQARDEAPPTALRARVLQNAYAVQADFAAVQSPPRRVWWAEAVAAFGGWRIISGVTAAGLMGLGVGLAAPDTIGSMLEAGTLTLGWGADYQLSPDLAGLWMESGDV